MVLRAAIGWITSGLLHVLVGVCLSALAHWSWTEHEWEVVTRSGGAIVLTVRAAPPEDQPPVEIPIEQPAPPEPIAPKPVSVERVTLDSPLATEFAPLKTVEQPTPEPPTPVVARSTPKEEIPALKPPQTAPHIQRQPVEQETEVAVTVELPLQVAPVVGSRVDRMPSQLATNVHPSYPADAIARREAGRVMIRATIGASGDVSEAAVHRSSGSTSLDRAALEAVQRWRFSPARRDGESVAHEVLLPIDFVLR